MDFFCVITQISATNIALFLKVGIGRDECDGTIGHARPKNPRQCMYQIADMYGLPAAIQNPIAIFIYGNQTKAQNIIIATERDSKKFVVGLHLNQWRKDVIVNSIRGLFNKNTAEWLNWVAQGKLLYVDKEEIQTLIDKQRTNLADVAYLDWTWLQK